MEPKDVVGLRDALERLISSRDLRESLGANGAALVREHFSADYMATQYLSTYEGATC
jgi:glycosyltransferase involved in cell wall biosynthesis